jgi:hypothetical protein
MPFGLQTKMSVYLPSKESLSLYWVVELNVCEAFWHVPSMLLVACKDALVESTKSLIPLATSNVK